MHRVGHQFVQAKAFAVQHLLHRLQGGQFKQLLGQAAQLVALRQRGVDMLGGLLGVAGARAQGFQVAMQGGQRGAQIVRHVGNDFAVRGGMALLLVVLQRQALGHRLKAVTQGADFIGCRQHVHERVVIARRAESTASPASRAA